MLFYIAMNKIVSYYVLNFIGFYGYFPIIINYLFGILLFSSFGLIMLANVFFFLISYIIIIF